ncbi:hypothetical protein L3X37_09810 [Sabulilitoribacter arenilitoris]|uniref:Uncharacterized protein n=1 Tax=Wocania arenilitoris TaxID=2044858 RepID=A0AAE3JPX5_9FLAO|nr:hypothetical protein [Wocania arenilitoris]MCF7568660.1 hypothetical protein [Wocania arenilitoris]
MKLKQPDAVYLVKVNNKLHYTMTNFNSDNIEINDLGNIVVDTNAIEPNIFRD